MTGRVWLLVVALVLGVWLLSSAGAAAGFAAGLLVGWACGHVRGQG